MYIRCLMESEVLTLMGLYLYTRPLHATSLRWNFFSIPVRTFKKMTQRSHVDWWQPV